MDYLSQSVLFYSIALRVGLRQAYDQSRGEDHVSSPWPAQTVLEVGVPFNLLLTFYDSRFHENNSDGGSATKMWYVVIILIVHRQ